MARERPTASDVQDPGSAASPQPPAALVRDRSNAELEELAEIVLRAGRLGFCRTRVATALGISPDELAMIERRHL